MTEPHLTRMQRCYVKNVSSQSKAYYHRQIAVCDFAKFIKAMLLVFALKTILSSKVTVTLP
jgi:hypothetical protein